MLNFLLNPVYPSLSVPNTYISLSYSTFRRLWGHNLEVLDAGSAEQIYRELYKTLGKAIGPQMAKNIINMGETDFVKENPSKSLAMLNTSLVTAFGKATAQVMVTTSVKSCFEDERAQLILGELSRLGILGD